MHMTMWFTKHTKEPTNISLKEYDDLCKRLSNVEAKLSSIEIENTVLRNKVLRKIQRHNLLL
jgi:hypothetical protein